MKKIQSLYQASETKIVMLVIDGLGGLPHGKTGMTELETAHTPNLDALAAKSIRGLHVPVGDGITPGSGPAHLGLFGYDPLQYQVGRGTLGALGINFDLRPEDVAARGNFCTIDENGQVTDRREAVKQALAENRIETATAVSLGIFFWILPALLVASLIIRYAVR